jgi:hypothetical protein
MSHRQQKHPVHSPGNGSNDPLILVPCGEKGASLIGKFLQAGRGKERLARSKPVVDRQVR